jgi:hypothetical protein
MFLPLQSDSGVLMILAINPFNSVQFHEEVQDYFPLTPYTATQPPGQASLLHG